MAAEGKLQALSSLSIDRTRRAPPRSSTGWLAVTGLLLLSAGGGLLWAYRDHLQAPLVVKTATAQTLTEGQSKTVLTATGYLESRLQAAVGAKAAGRITQIPVEEGKTVKRGDLLAVLEHSDLDARSTSSARQRN